MSEEKIYPCMPELAELFPADFMLLYLGCTLSNVVINKENKTMTIPDVYNYSEEEIQIFQDRLNNFETEFYNQLDGQEINENDRRLFVELNKYLDTIRERSL
jgi:hypothetical protein